MYNYMKTWETSVRRNPAHQLEQTNSYAMHVIPCQVIKLMEQHTYILCIYVYPYSGTYSGTPGMCTECLLFPTAVSPSSVTGSIRNSQPSPTTSSLNISTDLWPPVGWAGWTQEPSHRLWISFRSSFMSLGLVRLPRYFLTDHSRLLSQGLLLYLRQWGMHVCWLEHKKKEI